MSTRNLLCALVISTYVCCWLVASGNSSQLTATSSQIGGVFVFLQDPSWMSQRACDDGDISAGDEDLADHGAVPQPEGEAGRCVNDGGGHSGEVECQVCHKRFKNDKSMFGHLRSHPNRGYKGAAPPLKISSTPSSSSSPPVLPVGDTPSSSTLTTPRPVGDSNFSMPMSDVSLSTYERLAACVMVTLRHRYRPGWLQPPSLPSCSNKRKHETAPGAGELATSIMEGAEGSSAVLRDEHEARRKGKRKLKEPREAQRKVKDGPSRKEKRRPYMCKHCNEEFSTHQALGGHMAGHHKEKRIPREKQPERSLVLEEHPERNLILKEKQAEKGLILGEKQPGRSLVLKETQPERSLILKEKQTEVYQDKIDQTMNWQETESDGVPYIDDGSNNTAVAEEDRRPPFGFDLNAEAPEQE